MLRTIILYLLFPFPNVVYFILPLGVENSIDAIDGKIVCDAVLACGGFSTGPPTELIPGTTFISVRGSRTRMAMLYIALEIILAFKTSATRSYRQLYIGVEMIMLDYLPYSKPMYDQQNGDKGEY